MIEQYFALKYGILIIAIAAIGVCIIAVIIREAVNCMSCKKKKPGGGKKK